MLNALTEKDRQTHRQTDRHRASVIITSDFLVCYFAKYRVVAHYIPKNKN